MSSGLILKNRPQPRSTYLFLGNVALADFIRGLTWLYYWLYYWLDNSDRHASHISCVIHEGTKSSSSLVSILSVGLVAFDRYLYIIHGLKYQTLLNSQRAYLLIIIAWILGCTIGYLPLMGWNSDTYNGQKCWFVIIVPPNLILLTVIIAVVPIVSTIIAYSVILYHAIKTISQSQQEDTSQCVHKLRQFKGGCQGLSVNHNSNKWKAVKVVIFTLSSFAITRLPYLLFAYVYVASCKGVKTKQCNVLKGLVSTPGPLGLLAFFNSLLNPIIYAWWHKGCRTSLFKFFKTENIYHL